MYYLTRVLKTLKKVTWEELTVSLKHTVIIVATVTCTACIYWLFNMAITGLFQHL